MEEAVNTLTANERSGVFISYIKGAREHEAWRDEDIRRSSRPYDSRRMQPVSTTRRLQPDEQAICTAKLLELREDEDKLTFMFEMTTENNADGIKDQQKAYELYDTLPERSRQEAKARAEDNRTRSTMPITAKRKPPSFGAYPRTAKASKSRGSAE